jgi:hypothetical protein
LRNTALQTSRLWFPTGRFQDLVSLKILPKEIFSLSCHTARSRLVFRVGGVLEGRGALARALGFGLAFNGLIMFAIPAAWYASFPGVAVAGPIWMVSPLLADQGNKGEQPC